MITFGVIGAGWRSEFYIRIAALLPEQFCLAGMYVRNAARAKELATRYNVKIYDNLDDLLAVKPDFVVSCVNNAGMCDMVTTLARRGVAVLSETPIGVNAQQTDEILRLAQPDWRVQVAEQFHFQPRNMAIKAVINSGIIGEVHHVQISCCHDYHAVSLMRFFLGEKATLPTVTAVQKLEDPVLKYDARSGVFDQPKLVNSNHILALARYGCKSAVYDFSSEQYFSDIRETRLLIRGTKGEISNNTCRYLVDNHPMCFSLVEHRCGARENLDGMYLDSISGQGHILYDNPFKPARLTDEEIAVATCLAEMQKYIADGTPFYTLQEAAVDAKTGFLFHTDVKG